MAEEEKPFLRRLQGADAAATTTSRDKELLRGLGSRRSSVVRALFLARPLHSVFPFSSTGAAAAVVIEMPGRRPHVHVIICSLLLRYFVPGA